MTNQFDPSANARDEDDPLSIFESINTPTETQMKSAAATTENQIDLLSDFAGAPVASEESDDESDEVKEDESTSEEKSEGDYDPDDLLDTEGWNVRRRNASEDEDEIIPSHDRVGLTSSGGMNRTNSQMDEINTNGRSNSRRGLFGWASRRGPSSTYKDNPNPEDNYSQLPSDGIDEAALAYGEGGLTGDDDQDEADTELEEEQRMDNELRPGDHIYVWQTYGINPRAYQRHAVVLSVTRRGGQSSQLSLDNTVEPLSYDIDNLYNDSYYDEDIEVTVVSFYHFQRHASHGAAQAAAANGNRRGKRTGCKPQLLKEFIGEDGLKKKKPVHKVRYGRKVKRGILSQKASVGTALKKDQVGLILSRVRYLLDHPDHLPEHNALSANGECAALWCVTGFWCTLQGASILQITCMGQAGGALLAGGVLSNLTVLVPMPGLWGMAGWWWYVPATVAYPFLVPMLVALGMCSLVPLEILRRNRKKWRGITDGLNHEFWSNASDEVKEEYFGVMATAEKEAELRSFFGIREGEATTDDAKYMPVGGTPGGMDDSDDEEDEAMALQKMERLCADMNVDLSGKPPSQSSNGSGWGSFVGSFRRKDGVGLDDVDRGEQEGIIS
jgi:hypothetical protein